MVGHVARIGRDVHTGFTGGNLRKRDHLKDPSVDGRILLKWIFRKWNGDTYWIDLALERDE
jgi:hypothetical protein